MSLPRAYREVVTLRRRAKPIDLVAVASLLSLGMLIGVCVCVAVMGMLVS